MLFRSLSFHLPEIINTLRGKSLYLPLGGFFIALFVGHAWGVDKAIKGLLMGDSNNSRFGNSIFKNATVVSVFGFLVKFISPLLIFLVFLYQFGLI